MRSRRLNKKLHKLWLVDVARDIVMDKTIEEVLWKLKQGEEINLQASNYHRSAIMKRYSLDIVLVRGPLEGSCFYKEFDPEELTLYFYAKNFPEVLHGWTLFSDEVDT